MSQLEKQDKTENRIKELEKLNAQLTTQLKKKAPVLTKH